MNPLFCLSGEHPVSPGPCLRSWHLFGPVGSYTRDVGQSGTEEGSQGFGPDLFEGAGLPRHGPHRSLTPVTLRPLGPGTTSWGTGQSVRQACPLSPGPGTDEVEASGRSLSLMGTQTPYLHGCLVSGWDRAGRGAHWSPASCGGGGSTHVDDSMALVRLRMGP